MKLILNKFKQLRSNIMVDRYSITNDEYCMHQLATNQHMSNIKLRVGDLSDITQILTITIMREMIDTINTIVIEEGFNSLEELKYMRPELFI